MRKAISFLLILSMVLMTVLPAFASPAAEQWELFMITSNGTRYDPVSLEWSMSVTLNDDGTASVVRTGNGKDANFTGTWMESGGLIVISVNDGNTLTFTRGESELTFVEDELTCTFACSTAEITPPIGDWSLQELIMNEQSYTAEELGAEVDISFADSMRGTSISPAMAMKARNRSTIHRSVSTYAAKRTAVSSIC